MNIPERISALRALMEERGYDVYMVPTDDFHQSEYVGDHFKVREYITGFTGSAGTAVFTKDEAGLWTDGRYFLQADQQLAGTGVKLYKMGEPGAHTGKFHVIGHQLIGRTGKEALVRFGHTCHHDCFHCLSVGFEAHADVGGDGCFPGFITYIGNLQLPPPFRAGI